MKKSRLSGVVCACLFSFVTTASEAVSVFVGSYEVNDGPLWTTNPEVYSATEAAALIFGGVTTDYFISTNSSLDPTTITHTGWYDGWGEHTGMEFGENYKLDTGTPGYNDPGGTGTARSAYVSDVLGDAFINYVWTSDVAAVPIPAAAWLFGSGLLGLIGIARRKKTA